MENLNFKENILQNWINSDKNLSDVLVEIQELPISMEEQAEFAFHKLSELYNLPKNPDDVLDRELQRIADCHLYDPISVYEQLGYCKFVEENEDLRSLVLKSVYLVKNKFSINFEDKIDLLFGDSYENIQGIGFKGKNTNVELVFVKNGESWFDLGCNMFTKIV